MIRKMKNLLSAQENFFKVKKNVTLITCQGVFVEGGAVIQTTEDDLPDDIKELVEMGAYSLEEALALCTENASKNAGCYLLDQLLS